MKKEEYAKQEYLEKFRDFLDSGTTKASITKIVLIALAIASLPGLIFVAAAMGNVVQIISQSRFGKQYNKKQIRNAMVGIHRQKLIKHVIEKNGKNTIRITKKGESRLQTFAIDFIEIEKPKRWDGKWRLVIFDLPIKFNKARENLRWKLKELGFIQFQKSAWIYPYPCKDEIMFVANFYEVGEYVEILTVDSFLNEEKIKRHFNFL